MTTLEIKDSRRLTGPNLLWDLPGAGLEAFGSENEIETLVHHWEGHARRILDAVCWESEQSAIRRFPGGASLAISAPIDALYAATEVNEWAVEAAVADISGEEQPDIKEAAERLRGVIAQERNPSLLALRRAASTHGVSFLWDDEFVSIGLGKGSRTCDTDDIPRPDSIDWAHVHDIPITLVTGTNGKSTTVRLLASMIRTHGLEDGFSSTDGIFVGGELVEQGDYSGPEGARAVLRNRGVETAVLETARGGILRRGLPVLRADACLVTNVAEDHLGEYGVNDLDTLIRAKLVVHRAVTDDGLLVLNADDTGLSRFGPSLGVPLAWFSLVPDHPVIQNHVKAGGLGAWLDDGKLVLARENKRTVIIASDNIPISLGGAARHNISNSLAAILVADHLGIPIAAMNEGLCNFTGTPEENPGRGNVFELGGVTALVDFAHNAHGFESLFAMANAIPAKRRLVLFGQAGDRTDASILEQTEITWKARPDRIIIKEMEEYLRGREKGKVTGMIETELRRLGASDDMIGYAENEMEAVHQALQWARPGDLLLLLVYVDRTDTVDLLRKLARSDWKPGDPLPR